MKLKFYLEAVGFIAILVGSLGVLLPALFSAASTEAVLLGFAILITETFLVGVWGRRLMNKLWGKKNA